MPNWSPAKVLTYYAATSGDTSAGTMAQDILDVTHKFHGDSLGCSAPGSRTDYINVTSPYNTSNVEGVFVPASITGKYPGGMATAVEAFARLFPTAASLPGHSSGPSA